MPRSELRVSLVSALLIVAASTAACGSDDGVTSPAASAPAATEPAATEPGASEPATSDAAVTVDITVRDGEITPSGEEVDVPVGEEVALVVTADEPGEIHVHSDPEHEFEYDGTGEPESFTLTIDRPGQVEVESHTLEQLIVKLVVS